MHLDRRRFLGAILTDTASLTANSRRDVFDAYG
jgi:hypothetical protein